jgi:signal transduction histidine kinase/CheY-like chemotaxis protein
MRLRFFLIFMAVAVLLPVVVFSAIALRMLQNAERVSALSGLHEKARGVALLVERELYSSEAALRVLASSHHLTNGNMPAFYEQAKTADRGPGSWTLLLDENGQQVINTIVPFGTKLPPPVAQMRVRKVLEINTTLVSDVIPDRVTKRLVTTLNIPVVLANGERYVLAQTFNTDHYNQLISSASVPSKWLVAIIDKQGHFIARSLNREELVGKPARPELVEAAAREHTGMIRHKTIEGTEAYDVFTHAGLSGWTVAIAAPVALVEHAAHKATLVAGIGMLAALVCAAIIALLFGGRLVQSIRCAANAAIELGKGNSPQPSRSRVREVQELHTALGDAGRLLADAAQYRKTAELERQALLAREKAARQLAERQNTAKDQFLAMLGHELRNPLAPISAASQLLKLPGIDEKRMHYISDIVSRQVDHMNSLVNDLLDVSRVTTGRILLNREHENIKVLIANAVEQVRPLIDTKHHHLNVDLPVQPAWVVGDRTRLIQIFTNLLTNAAKYTPEHGALDLQVSLEDAWVTIQIKDNGFGIDDDLLPRIFDLFSQGERTSDRAQGGLGLGLALVKSLVELHGGTVTLQSEGLGKGSTSTVRLPRLRKPDIHIEPAENTAPGMHQSLQVMIVDDNVDAAQTLGLFLTEAYGYQVSLHYSGKSALLQAELEPPDAFVLDIGLPDMSGYDLARQLRSMPQTAQAVMIAVTGYGQEQDREHARAAGFNHHFAKPANPTDIATFLSEVAVRSKSRLGA